MSILANNLTLVFWFVWWYFIKALNKDNLQISYVTLIVFWSRRGTFQSYSQILSYSLELSTFLFYKFSFYVLIREPTFRSADRPVLPSGHVTMRLGLFGFNISISSVLDVLGRWDTYHSIRNYDSELRFVRPLDPADTSSVPVQTVKMDQNVDQTLTKHGFHSVRPRFSVLLSIYCLYSIFTQYGERGLSFVNFLLQTILISILGIL